MPWLVDGSCCWLVAGVDVGSSRLSVREGVRDVIGLFPAGDYCPAKLPVQTVVGCLSMLTKDEDIRRVMRLADKYARLEEGMPKLYVRAISSRV